jgi:hypothetical protein
MPARKKSADKPADQSKRFVEAARKSGSDESGDAFERAFEKIVPAKPLKPSDLHSHPSAKRSSS